MRVRGSFVQVVLFARGRTRYLDRDPPIGLGSLDTQVDDGPLLGQPLPSSVLSATEPAEQVPGAACRCHSAGALPCQCPLASTH